MTQTRILPLGVLILGFFISVTIPNSGVSNDVDSGLAVGAMMKDFGLRRLDLKSGELTHFVWLSDFVGNSDAKTPRKAVLINFFATWCKPCLAELPLLEKLYQTHGADGLQIISINYRDEGEDFSETLKKSRKILAEIGISFPVLFDRFTNRNQLVYLGKSASLPCNILIDANGRIAARFQGEQAKDINAIQSSVQQLLSR